MGQDFLDIKYTDNVTDPLSGPIPSSKKIPHTDSTLQKRKK